MILSFSISGFLYLLRSLYLLRFLLSTAFSLFTGLLLSGFSCLGGVDITTLPPDAAPYNRLNSWVL